MVATVQESMDFIHPNGTDPAGITPFYQKAHFLN